jgi:lipopolysaccharide export system protein LptA
MHSRLKILLVIYLIYAPYLSFSAEQETPPKSEEQYIIEADKSEGYEQDGEQILVGTGNVKITHGSTVITCDKVTSYEKQKMAILENNVVVDDKGGGYKLLAGYVEYYREQRHTVASKEPVLYITKRSDKPIKVESIFMEMFSKEERGIASGDVWIYQEDITAQGDQCTYLGKEDKIILTGDPVAWQKDNKLGGDTITLLLKDEVVNQVLVEGESRLIFYTHQSPESEKSGEEKPETSKPEGIETEGNGIQPSDQESKKTEDKGAEVEPLTEDVPTSLGSATKTEEIKPEGTEPGITKTVFSPEDKVKKEDKEKKPGEEEGPISGRIETYGDTTTTYLKDEKVERVVIEGGSQGIYYLYDTETTKETGESVFVQGKRIDVAVEDNAIKNIRVLGDAVGIYDPGPTEQGSTKTYGRTIVIYMANNDIDRIIVRGDAKGTYQQEKPSGEEGAGEGGGTGALSGGGGK